MFLNVKSEGLENLNGGKAGLYSYAYSWMSSVGGMFG
jgi:hypothetical protein